MNHLRGLTATRMIKALAAAHGELGAAAAYAESQRWQNTPGVQRALLAAVNPVDTTTSGIGLTGDVGWDLAELARPLSILGRLTGLRRVPFRTRLLDQSSFVGAAWVGEGKPIPMRLGDYAGASLPPLKVAAALVITDELARSSAPSAEATLSRDLSGAAAQALDVAFIDVENGGVTDVMPAAITFGVTPRASSGSALADIDADLAALIDDLSDAGSTLEFAAWVMRPRTAVYLSKLRGSGGALAYPGVTARGGTLLGLPVLTSANVPVQAASGDPSQITLIDAARVTVADDGGAEVSVARHASVQLDSAPTEGAAQEVSLWQHNLVGIKLLRIANWKARGGQAAAVLSGVTF